MTRAAVLAGLGATVPPRIVTNAVPQERPDTPDDLVYWRTGIRQRHVVDPGVATGDLAVEAGGRALRSAGLDAVDLLVLATTTPDRPCPATGPEVASRLGLGTIPAFDLAAVCSGFVYALAVGACTVRAGLAGRVLVIGAEAFTTIINPDDRTTAAIFGDGAGAVVLRAGVSTEDGAVLATDLGSDGSLADLITVPAGGSRQRSTGRPPDPADLYLTMEGRHVFTHAVHRMAESAASTLERAHWSVSDVDRFVGHQANVRILHAVAGYLGLPTDRAEVNLGRVGNTSSASIPLALADAVAAGRLRTGDKVLLSAFGGGVTWGSAALVWPGLTVFTEREEG